MEYELPDFPELGPMHWGDGVTFRERIFRNYQPVKLGAYGIAPARRRLTDITSTRVMMYGRGFFYHKKHININWVTGDDPAWNRIPLYGMKTQE